MKDNLLRNIRRRRQMLGLDQSQLANRLGVSRITYSKFENGRSAISDDMFYRLSRIFDVTPDTLLESPQRRAEVFFRHRSVRSQREKACNEQMMIDAERRFSDYEFLEEVTGYGKEPGCALLGMCRAVSSPADARAFGTEVRNALFRQGYDNVRRFGDALESGGIKYLAFDFPMASEFGFSLRLPSRAYAIAVNTSREVTGERQLFTLCHEAGHILMQHHTDDRDRSLAAEKLREKEADAFASGMLVPNDDFDSAWEGASGKPWFERILAVKQVFAVSYLTVIHRLEEKYRESTGRQSVPPYHTWFKENYLRRFGRTLSAHEEACPADIRIESTRFARLARKAYTDGEITLPRLAELLGKSLMETRAMVNEWAREGM